MCQYGEEFDTKYINGMKNIEQYENDIFVNAGVKVSLTNESFDKNVDDCIFIEWK